MKDGYTLPEGKDYVDVAITAEIEFTSGAGMAGGLTIVVGDNSKVDISGQLGKEADEYVLLNLSDAFIREGKEAEITLTPGRKSGVDILTYDISATSNGNLWVGWDFSGIDMTDATEVIFLVKSEGAAANLALSLIHI